MEQLPDFAMASGIEEKGAIKKTSLVEQIVVISLIASLTVHVQYSKVQRSKRFIQAFFIPRYIDTTTTAISNKGRPQVYQDKKLIL